MAFEHQLDANGDKLAVSLFGEPLVVYRGHAGDVTCVQDRCAHKSCPLSLGYVRGGTSYAATTAGRTATAVRS